MTLRLTAFSVLIVLLIGVPSATAGLHASASDPGARASPDAGSQRPDPEAASSAAEPLRPADPSAPEVLIHEVANGSPGSAVGSFFELKNTGNEPVDLTGWNVYRCNEFGLRRNRGTPEVDLSGVVLEPGERFTVSTAGAYLGSGVADTTMTTPFAAAGFGLDLEDQHGRRVDAIGVYPNEPWPMTSECTRVRNLPNVLNSAAGESWQRVRNSGDPSADWLLAEATPTAENATRQRPEPVRGGVLIDELAAAGPEGHGDDFVELRNRSNHPVDISGWRLYRCTAEGRITAATLQVTVPGGTILQAQQAFVVGGPGFTGQSSAVASVSLADGTFGALLESPDGVVQDRVAVSEYADSACQDGDDKLPSILDYPAGESYQRVDVTGDAEHDFVIGPRTPGAANRHSEDSLSRRPFAYPAQPAVAISELATDPSPQALPEGVTQRNFVELGNYGSTAVDISGWRISRCTAAGRRAFEPQVVVPGGTVLPPGGTFLAARAGTPLAPEADAVYPLAFNFLGSGVWVGDADGNRVDSVGVYQANEMDRLNEATSPCTKGESLVTYRPDRLRAETYQRSRFTGIDQDDFLVAEATPGRLDRHSWHDPTKVDSAALLPVRLAEERPLLAADRATAHAAAAADPLGGGIRAAFAGVSPDGPLETYRRAGESWIDAGDLGRAVLDDRWGHPYQRLVLDAGAFQPGDTVVWVGASTGRNELQLSVWDPSTGAWRHLDSGSASDGGEVILEGVLSRSDVDGDTVTVLVQDGPRVQRPLDTEPDGSFADPSSYDFAISHITDTQYLSESYPEVYAQMVGWIVSNAPARKIEFVSHTGDLVQNWVDPDQNAVRAEREFERASDIQALLDEHGVPNSVLPGNHDSKRGLDASLFNEHFGPHRYADRPWYGGSIADGDNSANFSTFEHAGSRFLMLSLPYAYAEREIAWAKRVVEDHPDHNVVVSTHEHLTPKTGTESAGRSDTSRWVSRASALWERVVAPHRNVFAVLSGHFHGIGQVYTRDAGGIPGHHVVELLADYQEFRTHTGERATGFQRLLQLDLASGTIAVDTFSTRLGATASFEYDYTQFAPDNGRIGSASNGRPWRILEAGLQDRYGVADDEFTVRVQLMYPKRVATESLGVRPAAGRGGEDDQNAAAPAGEWQGQR